MDDPKKLIRFADLKSRGVVTSWPQLRRLVDNYSFPPGYLLSPAVRVWDTEAVEAWLDTRRAAAERRHDAQQAAA